MPDRKRFATLCATRRVWAISAIHGELDRIVAIHRALWPRLEHGDRIVYLGNMIGRGRAVRETIDHLLAFRIDFISRPGVFASDLVFLRGGQEEMWHKLLQLQFAADAPGVLGWMIDQGVGSTIEAYGGTVAEAQRAAAGGAVTMTRWTSALRKAMQTCPGHFQMVSALRRAAFTDDGTLLFVNTGLDPSRPVEAQNDSFWWSSAGFNRVTEPYGSFRRIIRGFDPLHPGFVLGDYTATVDGGCGFGGPLLAACFLSDGELIDHLEA